MDTQRRIVAGIGQRDAVHLLDWAASMANPGDMISLVHAYAPLPYAATDWTLPVEQDELMRGAAARHIGWAASRLRSARRDLSVEATIQTGSPTRILTSFAVGADLLVLGAPRRTSMHSTLEQLLWTTACPTLVVGGAKVAESGEHRNVMVVLRDASEDTPVIAAAFSEAAARSVPLVVLRPWLPDHAMSLVSAETAERKHIDGYLAEWQWRYPEVGVSVEIRRGESATVVTARGHGAALLVIGYECSSSNWWPSLDPAVAAAIGVRTGPTLIVRRTPVLAEPRWAPDIITERSQLRGRQITQAGRPHSAQVHSPVG